MKNIDFVSKIKENPMGVMATQEGTYSKTRMFQFLFAENEKIFFCTNSEKAVYQQIINNDNVSFCTHGSDYTSSIAVSGKAIFIDDKKIKEKVLEENPMIQSIYQSADNPVFKVFYIDVKYIEQFDFASGTVINEL
jgi:Uncharacterized conserved protein